MTALDYTQSKSVEQYYHIVIIVKLYLHVWYCYLYIAHCFT